MTEGIIHFVAVEDLGHWDVDGNAHINVGATNIDGRGDLSSETAPEELRQRKTQSVGLTIPTRGATTNRVLWFGS